jgi:phosphoserine phosphatase
VTDLLTSWRDTPTRAAIEAFVAAATTEGDPAYLEPAERIAVFDNDGTLWTEKPMPVQLDFIVRQLAAAAEADPKLRARQPFQAAYEGDLHWLGAAMVKHYRGDDGDLGLLVDAVSQTFTDVDVDDYRARVLEFFADARHPVNGRRYAECAYAPMLELLRYLEAHGFLTFIVSGGDRDFMRPIAETLYGVPRERVVGSSLGLDYVDGGLVYKSSLDFFDDGPQKPLHIWARCGRRPALACGNSNGDLEMLRFARHGGLRLVVAHDDAEREVADSGGAEHVLEAGFTVVSMKDDWSTVYGA